MILQEFKKYLATTKIANVRELSLYLNAQPTAIRAMADFLIRRHYIRQVNASTCHQPCQGCTPVSIETYEWLG